MRAPGEQRLVTAFAVTLVCVAGVWAAVAYDPHAARPLTFLLAAGALLATISSVQYGASMFISAAFTCSMLALAILGPAPAFVVALIGELGAWFVERIRFLAVAVNLAGSVLPTVAFATLFAAIAGPDASEPVFALALVVCSTLVLAANFLIVSGLHAVEQGAPLRERLKPPRELILPLAWTVAFTVAVVLVYRSLPALGGAVLVILLIGVTLMLRLIATVRSRTEQYTELTVGAVAALLRALEQRDPRAARHAAAVAAFARDIAGAAGCAPRECELAHTAGLLHDIGRTALADRVMDGSAGLTREDWRAIAQHPRLGAEIVRGLDVPDEVAAAVAAHHERVDGRGYPEGLAADTIPEIARIVAVAEVYDTITAGDTYRPQMSSFQAMVELRRVAGSQLDERFVEGLAKVLTGRELEYRHASSAQLDGELALERGIAGTLAP